VGHRNARESWGKKSVRRDNEKSAASGRAAQETGRVKDVKKNPLLDRQGPAVIKDESEEGREKALEGGGGSAF